MSYTLESFILYCDDMRIADESLRETNKIYQPNYEKMKELISEAKHTKNNSEKVKILKDTLEVVDDTIKQLKELKTDNIDRAISVGSKLVSLLLTISASKNILASTLKYRLNPVSTSANVIGKILSTVALRTMSVGHKKAARDKCVKELIEYKMAINAMIRNVQSSSATESTTILDVANESAIDVVNKLKEKTSKFIQMIREWLQRVKSWISTRLYKLFKIEYITIDVKYYNEVMSFINGINNIGKDPKTIIQLINKSRGILSSTSKEHIEDAVNELQESYQKLSSDLKLLADKRSEIPTPEKDGGGKTINVATQDMMAIKKYFEREIATAQGLPGMISQISNNIKTDNGDAYDDKLRKVLVSNAFAVSNLMMTKANLCIQLVNGIFTNSKIKTDDDKVVSTSTQLATV